jgi:hypothetical protein
MEGAEEREGGGGPGGGDGGGKIAKLVLYGCVHTRTHARTRVRTHTHTMTVFMPLAITQKASGAAHTLLRPLSRSSLGGGQILPNRVPDSPGIRILNIHLLAYTLFNRI